MNDNQPVLVGVGQCVVRELGSNAESLPSHLSLAAQACESALADAGVTSLARHIDTLAVVRFNVDSNRAGAPENADYSNAPRSIAQRIGANPARAVYSVVGGQSPQQLVNEYASKIAAGDAECVLLTGAEAIGAMKHAARNKIAFNWSEQVDGELEDRGEGPMLLAGHEIANGLGMPPQVYGAFENACRIERGVSKAGHRLAMAKLFAPFSKVAAANPYAQFPVERSVDFLSTRSNDNYDVADPYFKWFVAQDAVNQGAALLLMSVGKAKALGIDSSRWVFPRSGADATDRIVSERASLTGSAAMSATLNQTLAAAARTAADVDHLELYSCFPCAVQFACDALGIDSASRQLTQTGGLPFFGGAGNNYSMHGIASLVDTLRADPGSLGLALANGGFASKESVGLYSTDAGAGWQPADQSAVEAEVHRAPAVVWGDAASGGVLETYGVVYARREPLIGFASLRSDDGSRVLARTETRDVDSIAALLSDDLIGKRITPRVTDKKNVLELGAA